MKKNLLLSVGLVAFSLVGAGSVFAEENTQGKIQFTTGGTSINPGPVDPGTGGPADPETNVPEAPQAGGNYASWVPNNLNFGYHEIQSAASQEWEAREVDADGITDVTELNTKYNEASPTVGSLGVEDNRGVGTGWEIKVKQESDFSIVGSPTKKLNNTNLTITTGVITTNITNGTVTGITGPASNSIQLNTTAGEQTALVAATGSGEGITRLPLTNFKLAIPAGQATTAGVYQANIVWTVSTAP
ncbi:WxL domain-containing protein [Enterococcus sp. LJL99]